MCVGAAGFSHQPYRITPQELRFRVFLQVTQVSLTEAPIPALFSLVLLKIKVFSTKNRARRAY